MLVVNVECRGEKISLLNIHLMRPFLQLLFNLHLCQSSYLTIILRNRAEYLLILSRRGRRPELAKSGDIPQD